MMQSSRVCLLGLLILASSASATTVGAVKGAPITGRPLEVNVPFVLDDPGDRACASANVRYGSARVSRSMIRVQGQGLKRNLQVTSPVNVNDDTVTVSVRVGCGPKSVTRKFTMVAGLPAAKAPPIARTTPATRTATRQVASNLVVKQDPKPVAMMTPSEPLFPPAVPPEAPPPQESSIAPKTDSILMEELHKARTEAAAAIAQLSAVRKELAAILDVERRTSQTLITAEHQVKDAKSQVAHMRLVLIWIGVGLLLAAAGVIWFEFNRVSFKLRTAKPAPPLQEPTILSGNEVPA